MWYNGFFRLTHESAVLFILKDIPVCRVRVIWYFAIR